MSQRHVAGPQSSCPAEACRKATPAPAVEHAHNDCAALDKVWDALGITEYTGKHVAEHVSDLAARCAALQDALDSLTKAANSVQDWFVRFAEHSPIEFGGEMKVWLQLEAALASAAPLLTDGTTEGK